MEGDLDDLRQEQMAKEYAIEYSADSGHYTVIREGSARAWCNTQAQAELWVRNNIAFRIHKLRQLAPSTTTTTIPDAYGDW